MANITFADVVHQSINFKTDQSKKSLITDLIDNKWVQRLRDISQTANTRLVYMFSEHSRFGHSLGVAYLANMLMEKLAESFAHEVAEYKDAVAAAGLLHDIGHLAPGSHTAFKTWFPDMPDEHESIATRIIKEDESIAKVFEKYDKNLAQKICGILQESEEIPAWTWQIISGGGWNVDRGNWCIVDSILAGVSYGKYNIPALLDSIILTKDSSLALKENRLDAMMHFVVSRHALYRQVYQHRVLLAADCLNKSIVMRARDLGDKIPFADKNMKAVLNAKSPHELSLETIYAMREPWWRYHLMQWCEGEDAVLADLSDRLINRRLFKTLRIAENETLESYEERASKVLDKYQYNPKYYLHSINTHDVHSGDSKQSMLVSMEDGGIKNLHEAEPLFNTLVKESKSAKKTWLVVPAEVKEALEKI